MRVEPTAFGGGSRADPLYVHHLAMLWRRLKQDPFWSTVVSGLIGVFVGAILERAFGNPWFAVGIAALVVVSMWFLLRHPIEWNFDNFLGASGGGGKLLIESFQATGRNRTRASFSSVSGKLISLIDNSESAPMQFVMDGHPVDTSSTRGVPSGATFQVTIRLSDPAGPEGRLTPHDFRRQWATFLFVVTLDGHKFQRRFSRKQIDRAIENFDRVANPPPKSTVKVKDQ